MFIVTKTRVEIVTINSSGFEVIKRTTYEFKLIEFTIQRFTIKLNSIIRKSIKFIKLISVAFSILDFLYDIQVDKLFDLLKSLF